MKILKNYLAEIHYPKSRDKKIFAYTKVCKDLNFKPRITFIFNDSDSDLKLLNTI